MVAAAVILPRGFTHPEIKDSKLLSAQQREKLAAADSSKARPAGALGIVEVEEIDRLNILQASLLAMVKALAALDARKPDCALIDGNQTIPAALFRIGEISNGEAAFTKRRSSKAISSVFRLRRHRSSPKSRATR